MIPHDAPEPGLSRRELLVAGAAAGAGLALGAAGAAAGAEALPVVRRTDFASLPPGDGWGDGWRCTGVANLLVSGGEGLLEAGSDVFPDDPRPVAFGVDCRIRDGAVRAVTTRVGSMAGVVLRRVSPWDYYAAVYDSEQSVLAMLRRSGSDLVTLAQTPVAAPGGELILELAAAGASPTALTAALTIPGGAAYRVSARDGHPALQSAGDPGVLSRARTLFPSAGPPVLPALGNFHLLPYGVQEGEAVLATPAGQEVIAEIRRESTVGFREITVSSGEAPQPTVPSVVAATTGLPHAGGARLHVASDLPADVEIEVSATPGLDRPRRIAAATGAFDAAAVKVDDLEPGRRAYWRATLRRGATAQVGPVRSFPVLPGPGDPRRARMAIGACATQFGPIFDHLAELDPDVFVWQGDLNYPDTHGPVAQTMTGYAGIWRDFLANPRLARVLERSVFVAQRDDHDYAAQDSNSTTIPHYPWGVAPWDALMGDGIGLRFSAGLADVWVLDQRRYKSAPTLPDTPQKTLLGADQREWLLATMAASRAPFKVICSPCTVFMPFNARDGNWATGFTAERDLILAAIDRTVSGRTIFVSGDTHFTAVYDSGGRFEARPCPIDIPVPNDVTISDPQAAEQARATPGVAYADERGHLAVLEVSGTGDRATLNLWLVREDGAVPYRRTFEQPVPAPVLRVAIDRTHPRSLRRRGRLATRVSLDRPGRVRLRATLTRLRAGRRSTVRLADRLVRFDRAGRRRFVLRLGHRGRAALARPGALRITLTGRYRTPGGRAVVRRARRWLRRLVR